MDLKKLNHFELLQLNCSIQSARVKITRHNKKNSDTIKVKKIKGRAFAYRDFFDIKEVDQFNINILKDQLLNALEKIKIFESDEDIL